MKPSVTCYATRGKSKAKRLCRAFAEGAGGQVVLGGERLLPGPAAFYGVPADLQRIYKQACGEGREYYFIDNAYFGAPEYFRITRGAEQHDGQGKAGPARWNRLGLPLRPWRRDGDDILIALQTPEFFALRGENRDVWLAGVRHELRAHSPRRVVVRDKPRPSDPEGFQRALDGAWALVTRSSNAAVQAIVRGIPAFVTHPCAARAMANRDLSRIETPVLPDGREQWAWNLAANQWTEAEMRDGTAWRDLHGAG